MSEDIKIGAIVELGQLKAGMDEAASVTLEALLKMQAAFTELKLVTTERINELKAKLKQLEVAAERASKRLEFKEALLGGMEGLNASIMNVNGGLVSMAGLLGLGVFAEFLEHTKEQVLETGHLSAATGISVIKITELKDALQEAGVSSDRLPMQLTKLSRAMAEAAAGGAKQVEAFRELGVSTAGWSKQLPDAMDVLQKLGQHLEHSGTQTRDLANMSLVFGRGVVGLTAFLKEHGDQLDEVTKKYIEHGIEVEKAAEAAKKLQQEEAQLKAQMETAMLPVFQKMVDAIDGLRFMWTAAGISVEHFGAQVLIVAHATIDSLLAVSKVIVDAVVGDFAAMPGHAQAAYEKLQTGFEVLTENMKAQGREMQTALAEMMKPKPIAAEGGNEDIIPGLPDPKKFKQGLDDQLTALKQNHLVSVQEELHFWQGRLAAAAAFPEIYREIQKRIAEIDQTIFKERETFATRFSQHLEEQDSKNVSLHLHAIEKELAAEIKANQERLQVGEIQFEAEKTHQEALGQIKLNSLEFERNLGHLSETNHEKQLQREVAATYTAARQELQAKLIAAGGRVVEEAKVLAEIKKLDDKFRMDSERGEQQSLLRRRQSFQQYFQQIAGSFNSALNGWIQGTETAGRAFAQMFSSILGDLIGFVEKWIEKKVELWLADKLFNIRAVGSAGAAEAGIAGAAGFASVMMALPFPENVAAAPGVAAAASAAAAGFATAGATGAASWDIGTNFVPMTGLAMVHKGEEIIPASQRGNGWTGSAPHITIHMGVSSLDKGTIRAAAHDIHSEVMRVMGNKVRR